jgi:hypothetical protein
VWLQRREVDNASIERQTIDVKRLTKDAHEAGSDETHNVNRLTGIR